MLPWQLSMKRRNALLRAYAWCGACCLYVLLLIFLGRAFYYQRSVVHINLSARAGAASVLFKGSGAGRGRGAGAVRGGVQQSMVAPMSVPKEQIVAQKPVQNTAEKTVETIEKKTEPEKKIEKPAEKTGQKKAEQKPVENKKVAPPMPDAATEKRRVLAPPETKKIVPEPVQEKKQDKESEKKSEVKSAPKIEQEKKEKAAGPPVKEKKPEVIPPKQESVLPAVVPVAPMQPEKAQPVTEVFVGDGSGLDTGSGEGYGFGDEDGNGMSRDGVALVRALSRTWRPPRGLSTDLSARMRVALATDGRVLGVDVEKGSGVMAYDMAARGALWRAEYPQVFWGKAIVVAFGKSGE